MTIKLYIYHTNTDVICVCASDSIYNAGKFLQAELPSELVELDCITSYDLNEVICVHRRLGISA